MAETKAIKRNESLKFLSHEHHHGLMFCTRLKKADRAEPSVLSAFVMDFWDNHLKNHFENEEKIFLSFLNDESLRSRFLLEHEQIKQLIELIVKENKSGLATELSNLLNDHIRFEERIMFPWLEKTLNEETLKEMTRGLNNEEVVCHIFKPEFWKNENQQ